MFPPRQLSIFVKLEDESSQSFCSAERREVLLVTRPTPITRFRGLLGEGTQPGKFDMQLAKFRPDRSPVLNGRADVDARLRPPEPDGRDGGAFMIEWESSAGGMVRLRARNSQRPSASTTTRLPALHAFQLQHGLHGPYAIRRGHHAVDGGVPPKTTLNLCQAGR